MKRLALIVAVACMPFAASAADVDADAAQALLKKSNCFKCHAIDKKKDGPPYRQIAKKYKGKPDAVEKLFKHMTTGPMVKNGDKEEEHAKIKSTDDAEIKNVINWILTL